MKKINLLKHLPLLIMGGGLVVTVAAFAQNHSAKTRVEIVDSPPKQKQIRDLDDALLELDRGEIDLKNALKEIDGDKLEKEIREAMKNVNIDMAKMKEDVAKALKEVDMTRINAEVQAALKELDGQKIQLQVQQELAKIDSEKIKKEIDKASKIDLSKMQEELSKIRPQVENSLKEAQESIDKARKEISNYKNLVDELNKDGLLNKKESYTLTYKNGELRINDKKLSDADAKKYQRFVEGKEPFTIEKTGESFNIHHK